MRKLGLIGFLGILGFAGIGCSSSEPTLRNVSGTVPTGDKITGVVAVQAGAGSAAKTYAGTVDASGHFSIALPIGQKFVLGFMSGDTAVGVLHWKSGQTGAYTTVLSVGHVPTGSATNTKPADAAAEVEDEDIALGSVDNAAGDALYEPSSNPEEQVDSDDDGEDDFDDADDDGDGEDDADESGDAEDEVDSDSDGLPDQIDSDDDGDGVPDASDT